MKDLLTDLNKTGAELIDAITVFNDEQFNQVPFEGSWTPAQVTDHIQKALGVDVLYGKTKSTTREPDENVAATGNLFLDMSIKMKSPDFILPANEPINKQEALYKAEEKFKKLQEAAATLDLELTCLDFKLPGADYFTRLEFLRFYQFHTQRHINQLKNIFNALNA